MTPIQRELKHRENNSIKQELLKKISWGDIKALADEGQYHYNTYRRFLDPLDELWSDGVHAEVLKYLAKKEKDLVC